MNNQKSLLQMEYYDTYSYVALIHNLVIGGFAAPDWYDGFTDFVEQYSDDLFLPFQKISVLHLFTIFTIHNMFIDEVDDVVFDSVINDESYTLWVNDALEYHEIPHTSFREWIKSMSFTLAKLEDESTIIAYYDFLYEAGALNKLLHQIAEEVFSVLFSNRRFLYQFNKQISSRASKLEMGSMPQDVSELFRKDGILRRQHIPIWARKAVFFRDRGKCSCCQKDISGLVSIHNEKHFDHIVPLALGGLNDVSNLQLLCESCNLSKSSTEIRPSNIYERWY